MIKTSATLITKDYGQKDKYGVAQVSTKEIAKLTGYFIYQLDNGAQGTSTVIHSEAIKYIANQLVFPQKDLYLVINNTEYLVTSHKVLYKKGTVFEAIKHG